MPKVTANRNFAHPEFGMQPGILVSIIDLGTQEGEWKGKPTSNRQLFFQWELPESLIDNPESEWHGKPMSQGSFVNLTVGEKAQLTKIVMASTGQKPEEGYDPEELLGSACNLNIISYIKRDGAQGIKIDSYSPLLKSQKQSLPKPTNKLKYFDLDRFDENLYADVPNGFKKIIEQSPEYQEVVGGEKKEDQSYSQAKGKTAKSKPTPPPVDDELDDEIPF